jgi:uncharacterized protein
MVPSIVDCHEFMNKYEMLNNIKAHSVVVEKVAGIIARGLMASGETVSLGITSAGALMHDIAKTPCLRTGEDHAALGKTICLENDLAEIAEIVGQHVRLKNYDHQGDISEKEIVYYADKRVNHDVVVSLEERLKYLLLRYGKDNHHLRIRIRWNFDMAKEVEKKLFANLPFSPEEIGNLI